MLVKQESYIQQNYLSNMKMKSIHSLKRYIIFPKFKGRHNIAGP